MSEYNSVEVPIIPDSPSIIPNEVLHVYVPRAGYETYGSCKFYKRDFLIGPDGHVKLREGTIVRPGHSEGSVIMGDNVSGARGYYYTVDGSSASAKTLRLSEDRLIYVPVTDTSYQSWEIGDRLVIWNNVGFYNYSKISDIVDDNIMVDQFQSQIVTPTSFTEYDQSVINLDKMTGPIELGLNAYSFGQNNVSLYANSFTYGINNVNCGYGSFVAGLNNISLYPYSVIFGKDNVLRNLDNDVSNKTIHPVAIGNRNTVNRGNYSVVLGNANTVGKNSLAQYCILNGYGNAANHSYVSLFGTYLTSTTGYQTLVGVRNDTSEKSLFAVGDGTSSKPFNAFSITKTADGTDYIVRVGENSINGRDLCNAVIKDDETYNGSPQIYTNSAKKLFLANNEGSYKAGNVPVLMGPSDDISPDGYLFTRYPSKYFHAATKGYVDESLSSVPNFQLVEDSVNVYDSSFSINRGSFGTMLIFFIQEPDGTKISLGRRYTTEGIVITSPFKLYNSDTLCYIRYDDGNCLLLDLYDNPVRPYDDMYITVYTI